MINISKDVIGTFYSFSEKLQKEATIDFKAFVKKTSISVVAWLGLLLVISIYIFTIISAILIPIKLILL